MTVIVPACVTCARLREGWRCAAYPDAIPNKFLLGKSDHRTAEEGDHGLRYKPGKPRLAGLDGKR